MAAPQAFGQILENPALKKDFTIQTGGYDFEVETASNFDVTDYEFNKDDKRLTLYVNSGIEENISEIQIPKNLINGNFTFYLDDNEIFPKVKTNDKISFIVLEFEGEGEHQLDIIGTTYLPEFSNVAPIVLATSLFAILFFAKKNQKLGFSK